MKSLKVIAALAAMVVSSATLAEGGADRVYGRMIQANEQAMQEYAAAKDAPINLSCSRGKLQFSRHLQRHWTKSDRKIMYGELFRPVLRV
ncbi:co-regulatory protein PtrA N-terminal domain-containing protein, partial [Pseudomonas monteilii]|uniref:co-regulatory protein PtrA N-terminal domain-containing protein n=1 Tax=Pseudomonas monteilii TaxID=76759 RepID=UPI0021594C91